MSRLISKIMVRVGEDGGWGVGQRDGERGRMVVEGRYIAPVDGNLRGKKAYCDSVPADLSERIPANQD
jgi:hypothetical protein